MRPLALAAAALVALLAFRFGLGISGPHGPDPGMWGLAAEGLCVGRFPGVLPGYPAIVGVFCGVWRAWQIGPLVSLTATALSAGAVAWLGGRLGLSTPATIACALATLLWPDLLAFSQQLQPDALATLLVLATTCAVVAWEDSPRPATATLCLLAAFSLASVREHGAPMSLAVLAILAMRSRWGVAAGFVAVVVVVVAMWASPEHLRLPFASSPLAAGHGPAPAYVKSIPGQEGRAFRDAWEHGQVLRTWGLVQWRLLVRAWPCLVVVVVGTVGWWSSGRHRLALAVALSPLLVLLVVWGERRHVALVLPIAFVGVARAWEVASPAARRGLVVAGLVVGGWSAKDTVGTAIGLREITKGEIATRQDLAAWMSAQPGRWMLGGQDNAVNLYLRWPRNNPDLPRPGDAMRTTWTAADWHTMWVAPRDAMPAPFVAVYQKNHLAVYELSSPGERPCPDAVPVDETWFVNGTFVGRCERCQ